MKKMNTKIVEYVRFIKSTLRVSDVSILLSKFEETLI